MNKCIVLCTLLCAAGLSTWSTFAQAQPAAPLDAKKDAPAVAKDEEQVTVITAEHLLFDYENSYAIFQDNVVVEDRDMNLTSDKLTVRFGENNEVTYLEAKGKVMIKQAGRIARSDRATYSVTDGKITLTGSPQIKRGTDLIQGEVILINRDTGKMQVTKPRVLIFPQEGESRKVAPNG
jgi:lipopolysaccharide transport protein LptA